LDLLVIFVILTSQARQCLCNTISNKDQKDEEIIAEYVYKIAKIYRCSASHYF